MPISVAFAADAPGCAVARQDAGAARGAATATRHPATRCRAIPSLFVRYPPIFDDLTFLNDVIRREHSPPVRHRGPEGPEYARRL